MRIANQESSILKSQLFKEARKILSNPLDANKAQIKDQRPTLAELVSTEPKAPNEPPQLKQVSSKRGSQGDKPPTF